MKHTTYGLDVAKQVFQMHWVEEQTGEICNRRFSRQALIEFLSQRPPARVALEACAYCPNTRTNVITRLLDGSK